jgi:hypothetical protein
MHFFYFFFCAFLLFTVNLYPSRCDAIGGLAEPGGILAYTWKERSHEAHVASYVCRGCLPGSSAIPALGRIARSFPRAVWQRCSCKLFFLQTGFTFLNKKQKHYKCFVYWIIDIYLCFLVLFKTRTPLIFYFLSFCLH